MHVKNPIPRLVVAIASGLLMLMVGAWLLPSRTSPAQASSSVGLPTQLQATQALTIYLPLVFGEEGGSPPPPDGWLEAVNYYRALAGLPAVSENADYSSGDHYHARYMVKNDYIGHSEDPGNPWYTPEGALAATKSNVMGTSRINTTDVDAIDMWMEGPFHAIGIIDPELNEVGFGSYREDTGSIRMAAALDVIRGRGSIPPGVSFPILFPGDGTQALVLSYTGGESPDPLSSCLGYATPSGPPILVQIGSGGQTPDVTATSFQENGVARAHCVFDETDYTNPDSFYQSLGRNVLNGRDAIVILPRDPLTPGANYSVSISVNGSTHTWSFTAAD